MKILYIGYWGANEGLSQATIMPHLNILSEFDFVDQIHYLSIERSRTNTDYLIPSDPKIIHHPYYSNSGARILTKFLDLWHSSRLAIRLIRTENLDMIMCKTSMSGIIGYLASMFTKKPFGVESFEPHADYMNELGIWPRFGVSYLVQNWFEKQQKKHAKYLLTASENYKQFLIKEENLASNNISTMPCAVDMNVFEYHEVDRQTIRQQLDIHDQTTVGIYLGKFGDIYWDEEAFQVFKCAFEYFDDFFLILLTPHESGFVEMRLEEFKIPQGKTWSNVVAHTEVPKYLSAADFAFSTIKPTPFRRFCSPIKNGEYWANGLPIMSPQNIGDDSEIIESENGGVIIDMENDLHDSFKILESDYLSLSRKDLSHSMLELAKKHRSFEHTRQIYLQTLS